MNVFQMSLSASVLIVAIIIIRSLVLHKLPKKTFLVLWGVVVVRLLVPFSIPFMFSFYTGLDLLKNLFAEKTIMSSPAKVMGIPDAATMPGIGESASIGMSTSPLSPVEAVWVMGMCACALFFIVAYMKCLREFKMSLPVENDFINRWLRDHSLYRSVQIRQSDRVQTPLTYGVFRPVILLPKKTDWTDETKLQYILTHEFTHIRRFDALTKIVLTAAVCVHWFNPFVWMMYVLANRDIELSCDETVVRKFGDTKKSAYASMLIGMEETKSGFTPLITHFSKNAIEERIVSIVKMKKTTMLSISLALALVIGTTTVFATSLTNMDNNAPEQTATDVNANENSLSQAAIVPGESNELPPYTFDRGRGQDRYPDYFAYNNGYYSYKGKMVAVFYDENVWNGINYSSFSSRHDPNYTGEVVYIKTVRDSQTNKVIGMEEMTRAEVEKIAAGQEGDFDYN